MLPETRTDSRVLVILGFLAILGFMRSYPGAGNQMNNTSDFVQIVQNNLLEHFDSTLTILM